MAYFSKITKSIAYYISWYCFCLAAYFWGILAQLISCKSDLRRHNFTYYISLKFSIDIADLLEAKKFIIHCIIWYCFCLAADFQAILAQLISCKSDLCHHNFTRYIGLKISINMADLLEATKFIVHCIVWYCFCLAAYFQGILAQLISCKSYLRRHNFTCYIGLKFPLIWLTCWKPQSSSFIVLSDTVFVSLNTSR